MVDGLAQRLLGGEVLRRTHDHAGLGHRRLSAVQGPRDAEVHHLHRTGVGDDDVGRLDVAVHDAVLVRVRERLEYSGDYDQCLLGRRGLGVEEQIADGTPLDQLHHDVRDGLTAHHILAGVVHRHHRMVVEAGDRLCLAREAGLGDRVLCEIGAEQLDRDGATEPYVLSREHLGHTAASETVRQAVAAVADHSADAPGVRRIRRSAAACFGFGCHQSSPSFLSACVLCVRVFAVFLGVLCHVTLQPPRDRPDSRWTGHQTCCRYGQANSMLFL